MSTVSEAAPRRAPPALGTFERYLTLWVALCILDGPRPGGYRKRHYPANARRIRQDLVKG